MENKSYNVGDWVIIDYKVVMIKEIDNVKDHLVYSDGSIETSSRISWNNIFPLTIQNKNTADYFATITHMLYEDTKHLNINWPDITGYFRELFDEALLTGKIIEYEDEAMDFSRKVKSAVDEFSFKEINGVRLGRR